MERGDEALRSAGVRLLAVGPGWARAVMTVDRRHRGGHGSCHGGYLFPLADARERSRAGRSGVYDVTVTVGEVTVAEFRGRTRVVPGFAASTAAGQPAGTTWASGPGK